MTKTISIALGAISLAFGLLKFVNPFHEWYSAQIETSGLPSVAFHLGILTEILAGTALLLPFMKSMDQSTHRTVLIAGHLTLASILLVASLVHLNPSVPAEVLPLKIKPPFIPLAILLITIFNLIKVLKSRTSVQ